MLSAEFGKDTIRLDKTYMFGVQYKTEYYISA